MTSFRIRYGAYLFYLSLWLLQGSLLYAGGMTTDSWEFWGVLVVTSTIATMRGILGRLS